MTRTKIKSFFRRVAKITSYMLLLFTLQASNVCHAAVDEVSGGGSIQSSKIGTGIMKMVKDLTGTLQWIIPTAGVMVILFYIFKIMTGDEQDQMRYKKTIVKVLICVVVSILAVTIVNLVAGYS